MSIDCSLTGVLCDRFFLQVYQRGRSLKKDLIFLLPESASSHSLFTLRLNTNGTHINGPETCDDLLPYLGLPRNPLYDAEYIFGAFLLFESRHPAVMATYRISWQYHMCMGRTTYRLPLVHTEVLFLSSLFYTHISAQQGSSTDLASYDETLSLTCELRRQCVNTSFACLYFIRRTHGGDRQLH